MCGGILTEVIRRLSSSGCGAMADSGVIELMLRDSGEVDNCFELRMAPSSLSCLPNTVLTADYKEEVL
jgi:hypothetical protein